MSTPPCEAFLQWRRVNFYSLSFLCIHTADDKNPGWKRFRFDLSKYAGAGDIRGHIVNYTFVPADKISIGSTFDNDVTPIIFARVASGYYLVKAGTRATKIIVK